MSLSFGKSRNKGAEPSKPLTPEEVGGYFQHLSGLTGGRLNEFATGGTAPTSYAALTPEQISGAGYRGPSGVNTVGYEGLSAEQLRALGGAGATRQLDLTRARGEALDQLNADPNYTLAQRQRARQLTERDYTDRADAIAKETEATLTGVASEEAARRYQAAAKGADTTNQFASEEAQRRYQSDQAALASTRGEAVAKYQADLANAGLTAEDMKLLADIYFGGMGQYGAKGPTSTTSFGAKAAYTPGAGWGAG